MSTRRDLLAFTSGAVAARTVLPITARAEEGGHATHPDAARARSLALWDAELMKSEPGTTDQRLTAAIVRDLIGEAA